MLCPYIFDFLSEKTYLKPIDFANVVVRYLNKFTYTEHMYYPNQEIISSIVHRFWLPFSGKFTIVLA